MNQYYACHYVMTQNASCKNEGGDGFAIFLRFMFGICKYM